MKTALSVLLPAMMLVPTSAFAGRIFGNLKDGGRSIGQGVAVQVNCAGASVSATTDDYGGYSIYVQPRGRCELRVEYRGRWTSPFLIVSSDDPARYDFDLFNENGHYVLKRR
jgi:hypothetical protein